MPRRTDAPTEAEVKDDLDQLKHWGATLDAIPKGKEQRQTIRDWLIAERLFIRAKSGKNEALALNAAQKQLSRDYARHNIILKARQLGITTYVAARFFIKTITCPGTLTVQVAHDQQSAEEIFRIVHRFYSNLDERWRKGALKTSRANVRQLVFPRLDSEYRVETAADRNAGRGLTLQNLHCSEVARWPGDPAETLASLRAALVPGGELVLESTPNGAGGLFYDEWQRADETGLARHFFPWWIEPAYRVNDVKLGRLEDDEQALREDHGLDDAQLAFRRQVRKQFRGLAKQEYAEDAATCFIASGECVFDLDQIEARLKECGEPVEVSENGQMSSWLPPSRGREYIIGADPAGGGVSGDYACAQVIDRDTGVQCAELRGHFDPREFARRLTELARSYNQALLAVERNNHGHGVLARIERHYPNLYIEKKNEPGWVTDLRTRPQMIERLAALLDEHPGVFASRTLLQECRTFLRQRDGSPRAANGAHDDTVIAMAIAQMVRELASGKNFRKRNRN